MEQVRSLLDADTIIKDKPMYDEGAVPRSQVCSMHSDIAREIGEVKTTGTITKEMLSDFRREQSVVNEKLLSRLNSENTDLKLTRMFSGLKAWAMGIAIAGAYAWLAWQHIQLIAIIRSLSAHVGLTP